MSEKSAVKVKYPTNPALLGLGVWYIVHTLAKHATTPEKKNEFIDFMYLLSVEFPCGKCRTHIQEYIREHSFEPYMNIVNDKGEDIGLFKWSWMFHNAVNVRLHKPFLDFDTAYSMFDTGREVCTNCSNSMSQNNSKEVSYEDSFEDKKEKVKSNKLDVPKPKTKTYVDKRDIIKGYFLKKHK